MIFMPMMMKMVMVFIYTWWIWLIACIIAIMNITVSMICTYKAIVVMTIRDWFGT